jgi:hypothetical protein
MKVLVSWMRKLGGYVGREFRFIMQAYWSRRSIVLVVGGTRVLAASVLFLSNGLREPVIPALAQAAAK